MDSREAMPQHGAEGAPREQPEIREGRMNRSRGTVPATRDVRVPSSVPSPSTRSGKPARRGSGRRRTPAATGPSGAAGPCGPRAGSFEPADGPPASSRFAASSSRFHCGVVIGVAKSRVPASGPHCSGTSSVGNRRADRFGRTRSELQCFMRFATIDTGTARVRELDVDKRWAKRRASVGLQKEVVRVCASSPLTGEGLDAERVDASSTARGAFDSRSLRLVEPSTREAFDSWSLRLVEPSTREALDWSSPRLEEPLAKIAPDAGQARLARASSGFRARSVARFSAARARSHATSMRPTSFETDGIRDRRVPRPTSSETDRDREPRVASRTERPVRCSLRRRPSARERPRESSQCARTPAPIARTSASRDETARNPCRA